MTRLVPIRLPAIAMLAGSAVLLLALAASAAEKTAPAAAGPPSQPRAAAAMPALPENAEEIEAMKGQAPAAPAVVRVPQRKLTPMMAELLAYSTARDQAMERKQLGLKAAGRDAATAMALQLELQAMKQETELEMLRIQARWAHKEGREADALRIEATIDDILHPKVPLNPEKRPAPAAR